MNRAWIVTLFLLCAACGGASTSYTLLSFKPEPAGANCPTGGVAIRSGADTNGDGALEDSEVIAAQTRYLCNGASGSIGDSGQDADGGPAGALTLFHATGEPPGLHCPYGGERIDIGQDTNGDGTLEQGEITQTLYSCLIDADAVGLHLGKLDVRTQADLDVLRDKRLQIGEIHVYASFTGPFELEQMVAVTGDITFDDKAGVTAISLPQANSLLGVIFSGTAPELTSISLPKVDTMSSLELHEAPKFASLDLHAVTKIGNELDFDNVGVAFDLSLPELTDVSWVYVYGTGPRTMSLPKLQAIHSRIELLSTPLPALTLPALTQVGAVVLEDDDALTSVSWPALRELGSLLIDKVGLTALSLEQVERAPRGILIYDTPLQTFEALHLTQTAGLDLDSNPSLTQLSLPLLADGGFIQLRDGEPATISLPALVHAAQVLIRNATITTLSLPALQSVDDKLWVTSSSLQTLDAPALTHIDELLLSDDSALSTLHFPALRQVPTAFHLYRCVLLPACFVQSLLAQLSSTPAEVEVGLNGPDGCSASGVRGGTSNAFALSR
ncbi:MAG: hypothetical protein JST92_02485 [Deltaproteobacteria bacterium]|nr:hypothetical protein [Deltaproteobacteria bacterium]